ncbi:MAG TPA: GNAT family protein [Candidatus Tumulicola sp.]|jgi:RimJ/RimL family protein N-acetyltransferase
MPDSEDGSTGVVLVEATDADFRWMLGEDSGQRELSLPDGGVDDPLVLKHVRAITMRLHEAGIHGSWLAICNGEVVGLCGYRRPPADRCAEIGYSIAPHKRRKGYATGAVAAMVAGAMLDPSVDMLTAETAVHNLASQRVLERNGFARTGTRIDVEDGEVIGWSRRLR